MRALTVNEVQRITGGASELTDPINLATSVFMVGVVFAVPASLFILGWELCAGSRTVTGFTKAASIIAITGATCAGLVFWLKEK